MKPWRIALILAWRDFLHEWRISACLILALAAVLAPLLVLFGLKSGILATMTERLLRDPHNLEITLVGSTHLGPDWFEALSQRREVGFLAPRTRSLAATLDLMGEGGRALSGVEMVPTAPGDPLLDRDQSVPVTPDHVLLSRSVAATLSVGVGGQVTALVARTVRGERQIVRLILHVIGIVPESSFGRDGVWVTHDLLVATEDFRDGYASPLAAGGTADTPPPAGPRFYASARLFARGLDDVAPLAELLRKQGLEVRTRAAEIEMVRAIDRVLSFIFSVIAAIAVIGYGLSLAASLWANVDRKRKDLALMRLVGFPTFAVVAFPATQAVLVAVSGIGLSLLAYLGVASLFNAALSTNLAANEFVCRLLPGHAALAAAATIGLVLVASAMGGYRASRIDPAESLRDL